MNFMIRPSATILFAVSVLFLANCAERNPTQIPNDEGPELKLVSQTQTPGLARGVTLAADKLYIADDARGVIVGDVSNLSSPTWVDTIKTISGATNVKYAHESNVLIIQETQYITAIKNTPDTSQVVLLLAEQYISNFDIYERELDNIVIGITDPDDGSGAFQIQIIHPDPDEPNSWWIDYISANLLDVNNVPLLGYSGLQLDIPNSCAYLAHGQYGMDIVEVLISGDNISLSVLSTIDTYGYAEDITLSDDGLHAIVADRAGGIQIFNISDKSNPVWVSELIPSGVGDAEVVTVMGDTVYFLDRYDGVFAIDISQIDEPVLIDRYALPAPMGLAVSEDHIVFVADLDLGLVILEWVTN